MILAIDLETTGTNPETNTIVEISALLYEEENNKPLHLVDKMHWDIAVLDQKGNKHLKALSVNKYWVKEKSNPVSINTAMWEFTKSILKHYDGKGRIKILGHNVHFDVAFLKQAYKECNYEGFDDIFSHRYLDTAVAANLFDFENKSLEGMATELGMGVEKDKLHTAEYDAQLAVNVWLALKNRTTLKV